jgi:hypothetical protein
MRVLAVIIFGGFVPYPYVASAKDVNVCAILAGARNDIQDSYDQAKFAVDDSATACADSIDVQECRDQLMLSFQTASDQLAQAQSNYRRAGCQEGE